MKLPARLRYVTRTSRDVYSETHTGGVRADLQLRSNGLIILSNNRDFFQKNMNGPIVAHGGRVGSSKRSRSACVLWGSDEV